MFGTLPKADFFFLLDFCFEVFCGDPALDNYCSEGGDVLVCNGSLSSGLRSLEVYAIIHYFYPFISALFFVVWIVNCY